MEPFAFKRTGLTTEVDGTGSDGSYHKAITTSG